MSITIKSPVDSDFCEPAFADAIRALKVPPGSVEIILGRDYWETAYILQKRYGCSVCFVPDELLVRTDHWAVAAGTDVYWSPGA